MHLHQELDDPRRRWLMGALAMGVLGGGPGRAWAQTPPGGSPQALPPGKSVYRLRGDVRINGLAASPSAGIQAGDTLQTGPDGELIFVLGGHAMLLRRDSELHLSPHTASGTRGITDFVTTGLRLLSGKLLSVSRQTAMTVTTSTATIGIRGTGFYVESEAQRTYFCTCYGETDIVATADPHSREHVSASQHDRPLYIVNDAKTGHNIYNAPVKNHSNAELALIEAIVGRTVPFSLDPDAKTGRGYGY